MDEREIGLIVVGMLTTTWGPAHLMHATEWALPYDYWGTLVAATRLAHGQVGGLYAQPTGLVSLPGTAIILVPIAAVISGLGLSLHIPGPSNLHPRVLQALIAPLTGHKDPYFLAVMEETSSLLRQVFKTTNRAVFALPATGGSGMEASLINLLEPGDTMPGTDARRPFSTPAAARRSSMRLLVQEPMKTRSIATCSSGVAGVSRM